MEQYIQAYISQNIKIFACHKNKVPGTESGFYDATTDIDILNQQFRKTHNPLIGLATGNMSGFVVIDFDINKPIDPKDPNSPIDMRSVEELREAVEADYGPIPDTVQVQTPSGGRHFYYKLEKATELSSHARFLHPRMPVDVRSNGGYVCAPDGISGYEVYDDVDGMEMSDLRTRCAVLPAWIEEYKKPYVDTGGTENMVILPEQERIEIRSALAYIDSDDRDLWILAGLALKNTGCASARGLWEEWSMKSAKFNSIDQEKRWRGLRPKGDVTIATIFHIAEKKGWISTYKTREMQNVLAPSYPSQVNNSPATITQNNTMSYVITEADFNNLEEHKPVHSYHLPDRVPFPKELLNPPGLAGDMVNFINKQSFKKQPILAIGAVLATLGALAGRKVQTETGITTNIYCMGVGASSCGKDAARSIIKKLLYDAGCHLIAENEDLASDSAINTALDVHPSPLLLMDEIGHFFKSASSKQQASYRQNIVPTLLKLYSSSNQTYYGKTYADKDKKVKIERPNLCIYGTTVPDTLYKGLKTENIKDGLMSRMQIFESEEVDPEPNFNIDVNESAPYITAQISLLHKKTTNVAATQNSPDTRCIPQLVKANEAATKMWREFNYYIRDFRKGIRDKGKFDEIYGRTPMVAMKIALILAVGIDIENPVITENELIYGIKLIKYLTDNMLYISENYISDNDYEHYLKQILTLIRVNTKITLSELCIQTQNIHNQLRENIIEHLKASRQIAEQGVICQKTGRSTTVYYKT